MQPNQQQKQKPYEGKNESLTCSSKVGLSAVMKAMTPTTFRLSVRGQQPTVTFTVGCPVSCYLDSVAVGTGLKLRASASNTPISTSRKKTL
jgi:hypothetical protein